TLDDTLSLRREAFAHAVASLARALPAVDGTTDWQAIAANVRPPSDLDADRYGMPLVLQMSVLLSLLQSGPNPVPSQGPGSPLPAVLGSLAARPGCRTPHRCCDTEESWASRLAARRSK